MNDNPSPLVPQGSMLEQKNKIRARFKYAFFCVLAIHIIPITLALLMQGCKKPAEPVADAMDTNSMVSSFAPTNVPDTNVYVAPPETNMAPMVPPVPTAQEYVVIKGDSFSTIAKKFGVTVKQIEEANPNIQPTKLQIGQKLQIPAAAPAAGASSPAMPHEVNTGGEQTYDVKSGDTLTKIANEFGITVKALRSENSLTTDRIRVGQKLKIPAKTAGAPPPAESTPTPAATPVTPNATTQPQPH